MHIQTHINRPTHTCSSVPQLKLKALTTITFAANQPATHTFADTLPLATPQQ